PRFTTNSPRLHRKKRKPIVLSSNTSAITALSATTLKLFAATSGAAHHPIQHFPKPTLETAATVLSHTPPATRPAANSGHPTAKPCHVPHSEPHHQTSPIASIL